MTKVEFVYRSLREEIMRGTLQPGERLQFADLARRFGVSAIPVREAVRQLESEDLVEFRPHTRVEVKALPFTQGLWAAEMRSELEPLAAHQATPYVSSERLARLGAILRHLDDATAASDDAAFTDRYFEFGDVLYAVAPNRLLVNTVAELRALARRFCAVHDCAELRMGSGEHLRRTHAALEGGDPATVAARVREHRLWALDTLRGWVGRNTY